MVDHYPGDAIPQGSVCDGKVSCDTVSPLVSICMPAYNNADHIEKAIQSVLEQTYRNIEIVVVDDASSDNTYDLVKSIRDPRIRASKNDVNLGLAGNWNHTMDLANGAFVKLMGADDLLEPQAIKKELRALLDNPSAVLAESDSRVIDAIGRQHGTYRRYWRNGLVPGKRIARASIRTFDRFGNPVANLIRSSALREVGGFDPSFVYITDYDFFVSIGLKGDVFIIHEPLNCFRVRSGANTSLVMGGGREAAYLAEHRKMLDKHRQGLGLTGFDIAASVLVRRVWSFIVSIYLKLFAR